MCRFNLFVKALTTCCALSAAQVLLYSSQPFGPNSMRELNSNRVSQLVQISGIITSASKPKVLTQSSTPALTSSRGSLHSLQVTAGTMCMSSRLFRSPS